MSRRSKAQIKAEKTKEEAIKIREEAKLLKKQAEETLKKQRKEQRPGDKITHDEDGKILPGVNLPGRGHPKVTFSLKRLVREKLEEIEPKNKKTFAELLINQVIKKAIVDGDDASIKLIFNYLEGMPKQTVEGNVDIKTALVSFIGGSVDQIPATEIKEIEGNTDKDADRDGNSPDQSSGGL